MKKIAKTTKKAKTNSKSETYLDLTLDLREALFLAIETAIEAGNLLTKYQTKLSSLKINYKQAQGLASNADIESEQLIIKKIKKKYKHHAIFAEETAYKLFGNKKAEYVKFAEEPLCWIIDPLDGTNNYLNGFDYYGVCICLAIFGRPVVGVVYRPSNGDLFYAIEGQGAYFNNKPLKVKNYTKKIKDGLIATGFATEKGTRIKEEFAQFSNIMKSCRGVRRAGSAALDISYVAKGVFDGFWERGLAPWDVAASGLIAKEAGVLVTDYTGKEFSPFDKTIIGARESVYKDLIKLVKKNA